MFKTGVFALNTGAGNQSITGVGFQPTAVLFFSPSKVTTDNTKVDDVKRCYGAATSSAQRWAHSVFDQDGVLDAVAKTRFTTGKCLLDITTAGAVLWDADFVSMDADGFTINITNAPASAFLVYYLAIQCAAAYAGAFSLPTSGASQAVTDPNFQPDCLIGAYGAYADDTAEDDYKLGLFFADPTTSYCSYITSDDGAASSRIQGAAQTGKFVYGTAVANSTLVDFDSTVAMTATGFTASISNNPANTIRTGYLALKGVKAKLVTDTEVITTPATKATTGVGFIPSCLLAFGIRIAGNSAPTRRSTHLFYGCATGTAQMSGTYSLQIDNTATMDTAEIGDDSWLLRYYSSTGMTTTLALATLSSFDQDGFTLNYTTADTVAGTVYFLALGEVARANPAVDFGHFPVT